MATINVENNTFKDNASVIQNYYEHVGELNTIKSSLNETEPLCKSISQLTAALEAKDEKSVKHSIKEIFGELFTKTFTGVASAGLVEYLKTFI